MYGRFGGKVDDIAAVVASAARSGLKVMAQNTGHGAAPVPSLDDTVLVRTAGLSQVEIDPAALTAWCGAGADWRAVTTAAAEYGLAAQAGSAGSVGIAGFLLSGGISWLSRLHGLAVNDVTRLQVVTADGQLRIANADHDPELFWALRGGGGSLPVVTGLQVASTRSPQSVREHCSSPSHAPEKSSIAGGAGSWG